MRVSLKWLKELVDIPVSTDELVAQLIRTGTAVEAVEKTGENLHNVVVGHVLTCEDHPNSDHLHVTTVDVGQDEPLQIVCGAPNVAAQQKVPVAMIGACLPGDFKIKKSKLRGMESQGMICSAKELGISADHKGIMVLDEDAPVGQDIADYLGIGDTILVLEITPNRPDSLNMWGFAQEVAAILNTKAHLEIPYIEQEDSLATKDVVSVEIDDTNRCSRYVARAATHISIEPSPAWMQEKLIASGVRPINNVVDITNYVMLLLGQPLHAFDLDTLIPAQAQKASIVVRAARVAEKLTTLDGCERKLNPNMTVIAACDDSKDTVAVALAGVMGGLDTEISQNTSRVLLESAVFDAGSISRTSRELNLLSEASLRYERKVDAATSALAADVAMALLERYAHAHICTGAVDVGTQRSKDAPVKVRVCKIQELCGEKISATTMQSILERLGCTVAVKADGRDEVLLVTPPSSRPDLTRECDMCEEILRLWGMDRITSSIPAAKNHPGGLSTQQKYVQLIRNTLVRSGMYEANTFCFGDVTDAKRMGIKADPSTLVHIINPLTQDQSSMRTMMIPALLKAVAYNIAHSINDVALFEQGPVFLADATQSLPHEIQHMAGVLTGDAQITPWIEESRPQTFYDVKGIIERVAQVLHITNLKYKVPKEEELVWLHPGKAAWVLAGKQRIGWLGAIHPQVAAQFEIENEVIAFEIDQDALIANAHELGIYKPVPTYPAISVDLAIVISEETTYEMCKQRISSAAGKYLESIELFDVYRDEKRLGADKKSLAFTLVFRAPDRSLTSEEIDATMAKLTTKIERSLQASVRK